MSAFETKLLATLASTAPAGVQAGGVGITIASEVTVLGPRPLFHLNPAKGQFQNHIAAGVTTPERGAKLATRSCW